MLGGDEDAVMRHRSAHFEFDAAITRKPKKFSMLQRRDIHTVILRGRISAGRNAMQITVETSANQRKKTAERRKVMARDG